MDDEDIIFQAQGSMSHDDKKAELQKKEDDELLDEVVIPPDGGWGWVIVFASLMLNALVDGTIFSFGVFFPEFLDHFHESFSRTAWIGSLLSGFYLLAGPLVSGLANKFGCRAVTISGGLVAAVGFICSTFAPNVSIMCLTYGFIGGVGFGMVYLPAIVFVGYYFDKRRALATGCAVCGSGIGTMLFAPFIRLLITTYGWKGGLLINGAVTLNILVFGALFRPLQPTKVRKETTWNKMKERKGILKKIWDDEDKMYGENADEIEMKPLRISAGDDDDEDGDTFLRIPPKYQRSMTLGADYGKESSLQHVAVLRTIASQNRRAGNKYLPGNGRTKGEELDDEQDTTVTPTSRYVRQNTVALSVGDLTLAQRKQFSKHHTPTINSPFLRRDVFFTGSIRNMPGANHQIADPTDTERYFSSLYNIQSIKSLQKIVEDDKVADGKKSLTKKFLGHVKPIVVEMQEMLDLRLLKNPVFFAMCMGGYFLLTGLYIPFVYLVDRARSLGISKEEGAFLLSIIGITNTFGRVISGFVADLPRVDAILLNNLALFGMGLVTILSSFCKTYPLLCLYSTLFGLFMSVFAALRSIIIVELLGLDALTNAFGLAILFQGVATLTGSPIAGAIVDATGSYDNAFYVSGSFILLGALCYFALRPLQRWQARKLQYEKVRKCNGDAPAATP